MKIKTKLYGMTLLATCGLSLTLLLALWCLTEFRVNGPVYKRIIQNKDIVADVLPPPLYVIESYLILHQMVESNDEKELTEFKDDLRDLRKLYDQRHAHWVANLPDDPMKRALVVESYDPAMVFFETIDKSFLPAIEKRDKATARQLVNGPLRDLYSTHRKAVDSTVEIAKNRTGTAEQDALYRVSSWSTAMIAASAASVLFMALGGWLVSRSVVRSSDILVRNVNKMASGEADLTARVETGSRDEMGELARGINATLKKIHTIVVRVREGSVQLLSTGAEISANAGQQEVTAVSLSSSTTQIAAAVNEISATGRDLSQTMGEVSKRAKQAANLAVACGKGLEATNTTMRQLTESADSIGARLADIREKADHITLMVTTIVKVADQTNILSVNAAVEAEKAGNAGLGFLVVAREIRRLADQTAVATLSIENIVGEMHDAVTAGVRQTDKFNDEVKDSVSRISEINRQTGLIIEEVQGLNASFSDVNEGMQNQTTGALQISDAMRQISHSAKQTQASAKEFNESADLLRKSVELLNAEVSQFKV
jgi:methyl-accepting chemotaxis protein WspA